ncbi:MAG: hypothetical protein JGK12_16725 [Microcoleus sp. PH2017_01_SCD_O_A]|uniref:M10 family metallopeptidase C-terminal domain-containing protein n=1 Tax=unclassified Microcoleus TaxID=2642155 RepID=UPI001D9C9BCB|nr:MULTISPECIES: hypothetical protein [unclassified Microcoleus]MCC3431736.1 hypothetical protein [Microcoleus sp. PH2017_04_SCI_O_A]MCC3442793.1 hypothetical protein [Microcoleus sp. PH2017_03_ELD_O_A]MCC3503620.1 hypothetical protein [Microcoleus sp. PH2017_19_SFW_U_A]MCC3513014.1 hypothetical protein [Microcoleus sp. PH2017_17_BER_D_A]TAE48180.1 MAG: hypothetical protein EAZ88_24925 [Oscillatoriales cyanobacterium]
MALKADTFYNPPRLVGDDTSKNVTLFVGQLVNFSGGGWLLGGEDTVTGSSDAELILGNAGDDHIFGNDGNDSLYGGKGEDLLVGENGNDLLKGEVGNDSLIGLTGDDILRGGKGNDALFGGFGNDTLNGDIGVDTLTGDEGNDVFVLTNKLGGSTVALADTITDFDKGEDKIALAEGLQFENLRILPDSQNPNDTVIQQNTGEFLAVLKDVSSSTLARSDFIVPGTLAFSTNDFITNESSVSKTVTVTRTDGSDAAVSATVTLDYPNPFVGASLRPSNLNAAFFPVKLGTVNFAAGDTTPKTVNIPLVDDEIRHYPRSALLTLTEPTGITNISTQNTATLKVLDDSNPPSPIETFTFVNAIAADGDRLLFGGIAPFVKSAGSASLLDTNTGKYVQSFFPPGPGYPVVVFGTQVALANNKALIASDYNQSYLFDTNTGGLLQSFSTDNTKLSNLDAARKVAFVGNNVLISPPPDLPFSYQEVAPAYVFDSNTGALLQSFFSPIPRNLFPIEYASAVGNKVAIAGLTDKPSINAAVYLFDSITGQLLQTLPSPDPGDGSFTFGKAIAAVGNDVLIGAPFADSGRGAAYLFDGNTGSLIRKFSNPNQPDFNLYTNDGFGGSLAVTDSEILIGASSYESQGAVYRFNSTTGNLIETYLGTVPPGATLSFPPTTVLRVSSFGDNIAIAGDKVAITYIIPRFRVSGATAALF